MIESYIRHKLSGLGFMGVGKIYYSLSYCQGDGVSFEVLLDGAEVSELTSFLMLSVEEVIDMREKFLMRKNLSKFNKLVSCGEIYDLRIYQSGSYVHENTMYISAVYDDMDETSEDALSECEYEEILELILNYAKQCANSSAMSAYEMMDKLQSEDEVVRVFRGQTYNTVISHVPIMLGSFQYELSDLYDIDMDEFTQLMNSPGMRGFELVVAICSAETDEELSRGSQMMICNVGDRNYLHGVKWCFQEARSEIVAMQQLSQAA